ncbi:MAG: FkbM family methyltransferase [Solirubrobacteraceae bacterium]
MRVGAGAPAFSTSSDATVQVPSRRLDSLIEADSVDLDEIGLVWIDVQGHEGHVLAGASTLLAAQLPIVCDYWPYGLRRAGAFDLFHQLLLHARPVIVHLGALHRGAISTAELHSIGASMPGVAFTDLLLLPSGTPC